MLGGPEPFPVTTWGHPGSCHPFAMPPPCSPGPGCPCLGAARSRFSCPVPLMAATRFPPRSGCGCCPAPTSFTGTAWTPGCSCSKPAPSASATSWVRAAPAPRRAPSSDRGPCACAGARAGDKWCPPGSLCDGPSILLPSREPLHGELAGLRDPLQGQTRHHSGDREGGWGVLGKAALAAGAGDGAAVPVAAPGPLESEGSWGSPCRA